MFLSTTNYLDSATITVSNEDASYPIENFTQGHRSKVYKPSVVSGEVILSQPVVSSNSVTLSNYEQTGLGAVFLCDSIAGNDKQVVSAAFWLKENASYPNSTVRPAYVTGTTPSGTPTALASFATPTSINTSTFTKNVLTFDSPLTISSGTTYWFGVQCSWGGDSKSMYVSRDADGAESYYYMRGSGTWVQTNSYYLDLELLGLPKDNVVMDLGSAKNPTTFSALPAHRETTYFAALNSVTLEGNSSDSWGSPAVSYTCELSGQGAFYQNTAGLGSYRYWRAVFGYSSAPSSGAEFECGSMFLGV